MATDYNKLCRDPDIAAITREWVTKTCPLIYVYAPSKVGKTTLMASLFRHTDYHRVLVIDADQGETTIAEFTSNEQICDLRSFDRPSSEIARWTLEQFDYASSAKCGAIVIEGLSSIHSKLISQEVMKSKGATGNDLRRCYIEPSMRSSVHVEAIREIKQDRKARKIGVPIFVTLNTKWQNIDPGKPDSGKRAIPDWSENLIEKAMRSSDAHLQLTRTPTGTRLISQRDPSLYPYCAIRHAAVGQALQQQVNLTLPGMLTLWATTINDKTKRVQELTQKVST